MQTSDNTIIFMITSAINVSSNPLFYGLRRSVFSNKERFGQVLNTIDSIRSKMATEDYKIILVDNTDIKNVCSILETKVDKLVMIPSIHSDSPSKSFGEASTIKDFLPFLLDIPFKQLIKISGRYSLDNNFNLKNFPSNRITARYIDPFGSKSERTPICTTLYSIPKCEMSRYKDTIDYCFENLKDGRVDDIEKIIFLNMEKDLNFIPIVGISGYVSCWGCLVSQ